MEKRILGKTGLRVSALGFGSAQLGYLRVPQNECTRLLNGLLDAGFGLIDTAASYYDSEEKIGKAIAGRRDEFVLVSKCGQQIEPGDPPAWSAEMVRRSAERSLKRLSAERLDVLLLHSCGAEILRRGEVIEALKECKTRGLARFIGYSGDNQDAAAALDTGVMDCLELSISFVDQQQTRTILPRAREAGLGILTKRSMANSCWRDLEKEMPFYASYAAPYTQRLKTMVVTPQSLGFDGSWDELALRYTSFQPGVSCAIVGGRNLDHLRRDAEIVEQGPLPEPVVEKLMQAWEEHDDGSWVGQS